jgi:hypothetical protein
MKKFICINDTKDKGSKFFNVWCVEGEVYTLERTTGSLVGKTGYIFKELKNDPVYIPELGGYTTPSYAADRFIELADDKEAYAQEAEEYEIEKV